MLQKGRKGVVFGPLLSELRLPNPLALTAFAFPLGWARGTFAGMMDPFIDLALPEQEVLFFLFHGFLQGRALRHQRLWICRQALRSAKRRVRSPGSGERPARFGPQNQEYQTSRFCLGASN